MSDKKPIPFDEGDKIHRNQTENTPIPDGYTDIYIMLGVDPDGFEDEFNKGIKYRFSGDNFIKLLEVYQSDVEGWDEPRMDLIIAVNRNHQNLLMQIATNPPLVGQLWPLALPLYSPAEVIYPKRFFDYLKSVESDNHKELIEDLKNDNLG